MKRVPTAVAIALLTLGVCSTTCSVTTGARPEPLDAVAGPSRYAIVGEEVVLDGSASTGAVQYQWSAGNASELLSPSGSPILTTRYAEPGRYQAVLTVFDDDGNSDSSSVVVSVVHPPSFTRSESSTVTVVPGTDLIAAVSPDADQLLIAERTADDSFRISRHVGTGAGPRTVTVWGQWLAVPCQDDDEVWLVPHGGGDSRSVELPWGSRPYAAAVVDGELYVSLQGTGEVARIDRALSVTTLDAIPDARGVAALPGHRLGVTRWRSGDGHASLVILDPTSRSREEVVLPIDTQESSDTEIGGLPSYLNQLAISPTGRRAAAPSMQVNVIDGPNRNGKSLRPDTLMRAAISILEPAGDTWQEGRRKQFDGRGFAAAATFSSRGDYLFVAMPGSRTVARYDVLSDVQSGSLAGAGFAPDGLAISEDDRFLYVSARTSRELLVYDMESFVSAAPPVARLSLATRETLSATELEGQRLFYDSADPRLSKDGYVACAHCHLDGGSDNRTWDFGDRGEGLRNTRSLRSWQGPGDPLHWTANFDEVHDFEHDIRDGFGGDGLMEDDVFHHGTRDQPLGDSKAEAEPALDALAAYVRSLSATPARSPARGPSGELSEAAQRGKTLFESPSVGCASCHQGPARSDSQWLSPTLPRLHDVGTLTEESGQRLGGELSGLDTPALQDLTATAPYLHDGSAATLMDVLTTRNPDDAHGATSGLSQDQLEDLVQYLRSL